MTPAFAELVSAQDLAERTGQTARHWQRMAAEGKIDFATQPGGKGTAYYFDLAGFEAWLKAGSKKPTPWPRRSRGYPTARDAGNGHAASRKAGASPGSSLMQKIQTQLAELNRKKSDAR
jgi:hypothetical protein